MTMNIKILGRHSLRPRDDGVKDYATQYGVLTENV